MRKRAIMYWAIGAGALLALVVALWLGRGADSARPEWPDPTVARTADGRLLDPVLEAARLARPMRTLDVYVTSCKGQLVEGATVLAEVGKVHYGATSDASGKAAVAVPLDATVARIVARRAGFEGDMQVSSDEGLLIDICPGATLFGRVIDVWGHTQADIQLELVDENGATLAATESDPEGSYALTDLTLDATHVRVAGDLMPLDALRAEEQREHDLLVGQSRVVSGFVLDLAGDPVPGVRIRLAPMQFEGPGWVATTGNNGGFSFIAPTTALRVDADGGDLGRDRAWVDEGAQMRQVELVLEPVGYVTVLNGDAKGEAKVSLRNWDQKAFGTDTSWATGPRAEWQEYEVGGIEPAYLEGEPSYPATEPMVYEAPYEEGEHGGEALAGAPTEPAPPSPSEAAMNRMMRRMVSEIAPELMPEGADAMDMDQFAAALEEKSKTLTPEQLADLTARANPERIQALMQKMVAEDPELAPLMGMMDMVEPEGEEAAVDPLAPEPIEAEVMEAAMAEPDGEAYPPTEMDKFGTYAEGLLGETIAVPANLWYEIYIETASGNEIRCGRVMVKAGEELTVQCGGETTQSVVEGRFVDRRGQPVGHLDVWLMTGRVEAVDTYREERQMTGSDGRFRFTLDHARPMTLSIGVGATHDEWQTSYGRRNIVVMPGDEKDFGDLVWVPEGERPESWPTAEYGGIGGLINLDENGVAILDMEYESPLALAGIEKDDTIVLIDGVPANELPQDEVFMKLRGAPGTMVDLRLRSAEGELYEVTVERQLIAKPEDTWGVNGTQASGPDPYLYEF